MKIELSVQPSEEELKVIRDGINEYNAPYLPDIGAFDSGFRFVINATSESGDFLGGLQASIAWNYCVLELFWLTEKTRGKGIGSKLIEQLVIFAREKGLEHIRTETLDFQAKPFYEKLGFRVYGELDNIPKGHKSYFLVKVL